MERYKEYKDSGVQWLGEIPSHWETPRLNQIGKYVNGYAFKPKDWTDTGRPIIRIQDLTGSNDNPNYYSGVLDEKYLIHDGDILVSWAATLDAYVWKREEAWLNQHIFKAIPHNTINNHFFLWLLKVAMENLNNDNKHGIMMQHLTAVVFNHFRVPLPPFNEQQAIAKYLDTAIAKIDEAIAQQQRMIDLLNERKQIIINNAVTKGLNIKAAMKDSGVDWIGEIPEHWDIKRGKFLFDIINEYSSTGEEELLTVSDRTGITPRSMKNVTMFMAESLVGYKKCKIGDICSNIMWMWHGAVGVTKYDGVISPSYGVYRQKKLYYNGEYLDMLLRLPQLEKFYASRSTGLTESRLRLYPDDFMNIYFFIPPVEEQEMIVKRLKTICEPIESAIDTATQQINLLQERKQIIINDVVTGKVKVS